MLEAIICREFKWTHYEYESQPAWLITTITQMLQQEAAARKKDN
jgi:hypothetical protein